MSNKKEIDWFQWIQDKGVQVTPVFSSKGIEFWQAGYRTLYSDGYSNLTLNDQFSKGSTLIEALENLKKIRRKPFRMPKKLIRRKEDMK